MSPDSPDARIGRLEQQVARLEQRVEDLSSDVRALMPLVIAHAEMRVVMDHMKTELGQAVTEAQAARKAIADLREHLEEQENERRKEEKRVADEKLKTRRAERWQALASILATVGLVIGAIQVLGGFG